MSFADERAAIEKRFSDNWTDTTVRYENVRFEQPQTAWAALTIRTGDGQQIEVANNPRHRYAGVIAIDIFVPEGGGTAAGRVLADTAEAIFRRVTFSFGNSGNIHCQTPSLHDIGAKDGWYQISLLVPYHRDKIF